MEAEFVSIIWPRRSSDPMAIISAFIVYHKKKQSAPGPTRTGDLRIRNGGKARNKINGNESQASERIKNV
jgi:hypothetical protein